MKNFVNYKLTLNARDLPIKNPRDYFQPFIEKGLKSHIQEHPFLQKQMNEVLDVATQEKNKQYISLNYSSFKHFFETGIRRDYQSLYYSNRRRLNALVLSYLHNKDSATLKIIQDDIYRWCNEYSWEFPAHLKISKEEIETYGIPTKDIIGLFNAETGFVLSEIKLLLLDVLDPFIIELIEQEIENRLFTPYEKHDFWWESCDFNWGSVCAASIGISAIINIKNTQRVTKILNRVIDTMQCYLLGFDAEGYTSEGVVYWEYGFSFYSYFSKWLEFYTDGNINLMEGEHIYNIANSPQHFYHPNGTAISFSDYHYRDCSNNALLSLLELELGIPAVQRNYNQNIFCNPTYKFPELLRNFLWLSPETTETQNPVEFLKLFYRSQVAIYKTSSPNYRCFALKGGTNNESHNHNDLGSFTLKDGDHDIFVDLGAGEYTKDYFYDETRYDHIVCSSGYHNIPIIDGYLQVPGKQHYSQMVIDDNKVTYNLSKAYAIPNLSFNRCVHVNTDISEIKITDIFDSVREVQEIFISYFEPIIQQNSCRYIIDSKEWIVEIDNAEFDVDQFQYNNHAGVMTTAYRLIVKSVAQKIKINLSKVLK